MLAFVVLAAACAIAALTALAAAGPAAAQTPEPLAISYVPGNAIGWDIDVAVEKGLFRQEGFDPKPVTFQNAVQSAQLLITAQVQLATGQADPFLAAFHRGAAEIAAIAAPADRPDWFLNVRPEIKSAADLRGKFIATAALQVGESWLTQAWLAGQGLAPHDISLIVVGTSALKYAALQRGSAAGAIMFQPLATQAQQSGYPALYRYADGKRFPPVLYVVNRRWAAEAERGKRLARALAAAHAWLYDSGHRDEALAILKKYTKREAPVLDAVYDLFIGKDRLFTPDAAVETAGVDTIVATMVENGALPKGTRIAPEAYMLPRELGGLYR